MAPSGWKPSKYKLIEPTLVEDLVKHYPGECLVAAERLYSMQCKVTSGKQKGDVWKLAILGLVMSDCLAVCYCGVLASVVQTALSLSTSAFASDTPILALQTSTHFPLRISLMVWVRMSMPRLFL